MITPLDDWQDQRRLRRLAEFQARRPLLLRHKGPLRDEIAEWGSRLFDGTARTMVLVGGTGTTKTWSLWEVLERAVAAGYADTIVFATAADWQEAVGPPVDRQALRVMRRAGVLVLDDFGSTRINEWAVDCLSPVVDERWSWGRPTGITSNLEDFDEALGERAERITSRLGHEATVVVLDGADRRAAG
ncbi:hypothetical protein Aph01nite_43430 [Acrocarpospora phusangensis]|uniref:IstB-like ATP-binding domain-containing protein n=1 Tax=Acrocarpospora phusangensis TaxID=1070424 RepID=A0A919QC99_9ACTN|nr:ATP-binding protein [Acrocarpospora phusangensis]GIH26033.1 hypothetical protein Aph01nite_43430 [Acrocarpospora phusangensis]